MYGNYKILLIAPKVFKVLAWVGAALGIISTLIIFAGAGSQEMPRWMGFVILIMGMLYCFYFTVISEGIGLLLEIKDKIK